jgi:hypothetical protein
VWPILILDESSSTVEEEFPQSMFLWFTDFLAVFDDSRSLLLFC